MKKKLLFSALALGLVAGESHAQIFRINVTNYGGLDAVPAVKNTIDTEILRIQNEINEDLPSAPPQRLMEGMANSSVMAGKGVGSDYASNMSVFLMGAGVGAGADLEKDESTDSDMSGVGVAPGVVIGTKLGWMDTEKILGLETNKLAVYANFMKYGIDRSISDEPGKESDAEVKMTTFGTHVRYDWISGAGNKWLGWGGVKINVGYEYNKTDINFTSNISEAVNETVSGTGENIAGTITGSPNASIAVNTHSIPVELSTDVQILYLLSLYGGLGLDYNFGQAKGNGSLNAGQSNLNCTGGASCGGNPTIGVTPEANIDATGKVTNVLTRGFAGLQINLPYVRIYGQVNKAFGNDLISASAGVRLAF